MSISFNHVHALVSYRSKNEVVSEKLVRFSYEFRMYVFRTLTKFADTRSLVKRSPQYYVSWVNPGSVMNIFLALA